MINLSNNQLTFIEGLSHLPELAYLDVSNNRIKAIQPENELPKSLNYLRISGNPVEHDDPEIRKKIVISCPDLIDLDKIRVVQAERFFYLGLLPKSQKFNLEESLEKLKREQYEKEAKERMEFELYVEMMEEKGVSQHERLTKNLEDYAKLKTTDGTGLLQSTFDKILMDMKAKQMQSLNSHKET